MYLSSLQVIEIHFKTMALAETTHVRCFQSHDNQLTLISSEGVHENVSKTLSNEKD